MPTLNPFRPQAYLFHGGPPPVGFTGGEGEPPPPVVPPVNPPGTGQQNRGPGYINPPPQPPTQEGDEYITSQGYVYTAQYDTDAQGNNIGSLKWVQVRVASTSEFDRMYPKETTRVPSAPTKPPAVLPGMSPKGNKFTYQVPYVLDPFSKKEVLDEVEGEANKQLMSDLVDGLPPKTAKAANLQKQRFGNVVILTDPTTGKEVGQLERAIPPKPVEQKVYFGQTFDKSYKWNEQTFSWQPDIAGDNTNRDNARQDAQDKLNEIQNAAVLKLAQDKFDRDVSNDNQDRIRQEKLDKAAIAAQQSKTQQEQKDLTDKTGQVSDFFRTLNFLKAFPTPGQPSFQEFTAQLPQGKNLPSWLTKGGEALWDAPTGANWIVNEAKRLGLIPGAPPKTIPAIRIDPAHPGNINAWLTQYQANLPVPSAPPDINALNQFFTRTPQQDYNTMIAGRPENRFGVQTQAIYGRARAEERDVTPYEAEQAAQLQAQGAEAEANMPWNVEAKRRKAEELRPYRVQAGQRSPHRQV